MKFTLSYKGQGEKIFVIFGGNVCDALVIGTNSNNRGVVVGSRIRIPAVDPDENAISSLPLIADFKKRDIFEDEEVANKALFTRKLKGEVT